MNDDDLKRKLKDIRKMHPETIQIEDWANFLNKIELLTQVGAKSADIKEMVRTFSQSIEVLSDLKTLQRSATAQGNANADNLSKTVDALAKSISAIPSQIKIPEVPDNKKELKELKDAIKAQKLDPKIEVKAADVNVDLEPIKAGLQAVFDAIQSIEIPEPKDVPETDLTPVVEALSAVSGKIQDLYDKPQLTPSFNHTAIVNAVENIDLSTRDYLFQYKTPDDAALPSGTSVTIDPVLNTEANVIDSGWIDTDGYGGGQYLHILADQSLTLYIMNASSISGDNIFGNTAPSGVTVANAPTAVGAPFPDSYYRIVAVNTSGTTANEIIILSVGQDTAPAPVLLSLDQPIFDFYPAPIVQSVTKGRQPDGDYVATPSDGSVFHESTPLNAAQTFTSGWQDTDGFKEIEIYIATDQVSASAGVCVEYTDDANATTPTAYPGPEFTFSADDVANGFKIVSTRTALDGFRIKYTNGGTNQTSFFLAVNIKTSISTMTQLGLNSDLDPTFQAQIVRAGLYASNDAGQFGNITRDDLGNLRVAIASLEAELGIAPLEAFETNQSNVDTTPVQIVGTPLADRKTVLVKNLSDSNKVAFVGNSASVTSSNGYELAAGEGVELDLSPTGSGIWAVSAAGNIRMCWLEIGA